MPLDGLAPPPMPKGGEALGAWWDEAAAQWACDFFPTYLRHTEGEWAGRPFHLADWQRDRIVRPIFGWKRADGTRLFRIVWIEVPRKNGKTELAAGLSLLGLLADGEKGGQVYSMAVDKDQAKIVFNKACVMAGLSQALRPPLLEVYKTSIFCPELMASFKPLSSGPGGKHGFSPSFAIGDEVHEWRDGELADVVHKGMAARRQPLEIYTTTAGIVGENYAAEMHDLAVQIDKGEVEDPTMLVVIFAASEDMDWRTEEAWRAANPNYGVSVKPDFIRAEAEKAQRSPRAENDFKRFHLNIWTEQVTRWLPMDRWRICTADPTNRDLWKALREKNRGRRAFGGLDLSLTQDLSSLCWAFPPDEDGGIWDFVWRFWLPDETIRNAPLAQRKRYESFVDQEALTRSDGDVVDNSAIGKCIRDDAQEFDVRWIGVDRYNATDLAIGLKEQDGLPMEWFGQGFLSMNAPTNAFERLVVGRLMEHGNNPVAHWMAGNATVRRDPAGNVKPDKEKRATSKIDGIVAAIMAVGGAMSKGHETDSVYEERGLRFA